MLIKDMIGKLPTAEKRTYSFRPIEAIQNIAVHHSLTDNLPGDKDIFAFARYHVDSKGWPGIGYHYVIDVDGVIYKTNPATAKSYHVGEHNYNSLGICLVGDFRNYSPPPEQYEALIDLLDTCSIVYRIPVRNIKGHSEFSGYEEKSCPSLDMDMIRRDVYIRHEESDETWKAPLDSKVNQILSLLSSLREEIYNILKK